MTELSAESIKAHLGTTLIGRNVLYYPSIGSTNEVAKELAAKGTPEGTLVVADEQTAGKGRLGREWLAPAGSSLLMSLLFRPNLAPCQAQRLTMICSLALSDAIHEVTGLSAAIKWPNDILVGNKKVCGILTELGTTGDRLEYAVVGMGLNVKLDFSALPELVETATSLAQELGREVSRLELLSHVMKDIEERYRLLQRGKVPHQEWAARLVTLGRAVTVSTPQGRLQGWAVGVDADGALLLRLPGGQQQRILAGDVTLRQGLSRKWVGPLA